MLFCVALETVFLWSNYRTRSLSSIFHDLFTDTCRYLISTIWSSLYTILEILSDRLWVEVSLERISILDTVDSFCGFLFRSEEDVFDSVPSIEFAEKLRIRVYIPTSITESICEE